jgi:hypothetical protein
MSIKIMGSANVPEYMTNLHIRQLPFKIFNFQENTYTKYD